MTFVFAQKVMKIQNCGMIRLENLCLAHSVHSVPSKHTYPDFWERRSTLVPDLVGTGEVPLNADLVGTGEVPLRLLPGSEQRWVEKVDLIDQKSAVKIRAKSFQS